ncbi:MAG: hypothetical protein ACRD2T_09915, partial [Thermoanaerobaculia bacterium]
VEERAAGRPVPPPLRERALNELAYQLWKLDNRLPGALRVFRANGRLHPSSWIAQGSLGEALEAAGERAAAADAYRRALALRPGDRELAARLAALLQ